MQVIYVIEEYDMHADIEAGEDRYRPIGYVLTYEEALEIEQASRGDRRWRAVAPMTRAESGVLF